MPKRSPVRNLIKFSHYSTCLILPKEMLEELGWQQGDAVTIERDPASQGLRVVRADRPATPLQVTPKETRQKPAETIIEQPAPTSEAEPAASGSAPTAGVVNQPSSGETEGVLPIPELTD